MISGAPYGFLLGLLTGGDIVPPDVRQSVCPSSTFPVFHLATFSFCRLHQAKNPHISHKSFCSGAAVFIRRRKVSLLSGRAAAVMPRRGGPDERYSMLKPSCHDSLKLSCSFSVMLVCGRVGSMSRQMICVLLKQNDSWWWQCAVAVSAK